MPHPDLALVSTLSSGRFDPYMREASFDKDVALDLYRWNNALSSMLFDDIAVVEVALRNSIHEQLVNSFGATWYSRGELFDDTCKSMISRAWSDNRIGLLPPQVHGGKLVASLTFGFWTLLLGRGSHSRGEPPFDQKRSYDELLWKPSLYRSFPGSPGTRSAVLDAATIVRHVRNRVAHHEAVAWGIPLPGQMDKVTGLGRRLSIKEGHKSVLMLASYLDPSLESWLRANSRVPGQLSSCPIVGSQTLML